VKEPCYRKILEGLRGPLDPNAFEECAVALLQKDAYRKLVPIHGGHDYGMDGALADGEGDAYPLIVTTAKSVIRNLTKNLDAYVAGGGTRRKAVVATSTELTATKRKHLQDRAREKGFILVQIHDQRDMAGRLYRDSHWAKELLGVTGEPAALSAIPRTRHPIREDVPLIGRGADLAWLRETSGDRIIIGQPGSGKTFLLLQLVREGKALFLASEDEARIAADLRDLQPEIVIVDDAHLDPERLVRLRQLRRKIQAEFDLLAAGWPGTEDDLLDALASPSAEQVRKLELLTRKEILEVLRGIGIQAPDDDTELIFLVNQASNKPGLAVTLGSLWLRGERFDVLTGKALKRTLIPSLKRVVERDPTQILACFALGGDRGVAMEVVGEFLGLGRDEVHRRATRASQGGVLRVVNPREGRLAVEPEALRSALLEEVFFAGSTQPSLSYRDLLERSENPPQAVETLVLAALRQVPVLRDELRVLVGEHGSRDSWSLLARLGEDDGCWVLENYPGRLTDVAPFVLKSAPREAVDRLLKEAVEAAGPLHSQPSHPLRILQDWVQEISFVRGAGDRFLPEESLSRRRVIVDVANSWLDANERRERRVFAVRGALLALSPLLESSRLVATGGAVALHNASLPPEAIPEIRELWSCLVPHLSDVLEEVWPDLSTLVDRWSHLSPGVSEQQLEEMQTVSRRILLDLAELPVNSPGLRSALNQLGGRVGLDLELPVDEDFDTLFPPEIFPLDSLEEFHREVARQEDRGRRLGKEWAHRRPEEIGARLAYLEEQARSFRDPQTSSSYAFCQALAEDVPRPVEWAVSFLEQRVGAECVRFLIARAVQESAPGWEALLEDCLSSEAYRRIAADAVLRADGVQEALVLKVVADVPADLVQTAALQGKMPLETLKSILRQGGEEVAAAAAIGEWLADPRKSVRPEVESEWHRAILRFGAESEVDRHPRPGLTFWLKDIFASDFGLAFEWLKARLTAARRCGTVSDHGVFHAAVVSLGSGQRRRILGLLEPGPQAHQLVPWLVDGSAALYEVLLSNSSLSSYHLHPLGMGPPGPDWPDLAKRALDAGYGPQKVAEAAYRVSGAITGFGLEHWCQWQRAFEEIAGTSDDTLRQVAEHGLTIAQERLATAKGRQRQFEISGRFLPRR